ncbi:MAG: hypothetical protein IT422_29810 [Pirellulaceae bacterium]|jgi:histone deacetylase 11|nr:hypothetical protein [Pirellulaceae bacterium]
MNYDWFTRILDVFNQYIYPMYDLVARNRIDCEVPVASEITDSEYLSQLASKLPGFLESICNSKVGIAIYNAGTDVVENDSLGGLRLSPSAILDRDLLVISELRRRKIPTVMLLSGGYTNKSYRLVANTVIELLNQYGSAG